jgi:hypothetical protein
LLLPFYALTLFLQGVSLALFVSIAFMAFLGVGQTIYTNKNELPIQWKDLQVTCPAPGFNGTEEWIGWRENDYKYQQDWDILTKLFSISPLWYPCYGMILSVTLGIIFSFLFHNYSKVKPKSSKLFIPIVLKLYKRICPNQLIGYVKFTAEELIGMKQ